MTDVVGKKDFEKLFLLYIDYNERITEEKVFCMKILPSSLGIS
jgi:hypothetical protein